MYGTAYEVLEFNPDTGEMAGVFLTSALGPANTMTSAEVIGRWPEVRELGRAFYIELEASYGLSH